MTKERAKLQNAAPVIEEVHPDVPTEQLPPEKPKTLVRPALTTRAAPAVPPKVARFRTATREPAERPKPAAQREQAPEDILETTAAAEPSVTSAKAAVTTSSVERGSVAPTIPATDVSAMPTPPAHSKRTTFKRPQPTPETPKPPGSTMVKTVTPAEAHYAVSQFVVAPETATSPAPAERTAVIASTQAATTDQPNAQSETVAATPEGETVAVEPAQPQEAVAPEAADNEMAAEASLVEHDPLDAEAPEDHKEDELVLDELPPPDDELADEVATTGDNEIALAAFLANELPDSLDYETLLNEIETSQEIVAEITELEGALAEVPPEDLPDVVEAIEALLARLLDDQLERDADSAVSAEVADKHTAEMPALDPQAEVSLITELETATAELYALLNPPMPEQPTLVMEFEHSVLQNTLAAIEQPLLELATPADIDPKQSETAPDYRPLSLAAAHSMAGLLWLLSSAIQQLVGQSGTPPQLWQHIDQHEIWQRVQHMYGPTQAARLQFIFFELAHSGRQHPRQLEAAQFSR